MSSTNVESQKRSLTATTILSISALSLLLYKRLTKPNLIKTDKLPSLPSGPIKYALAIHGGAGTISKSVDPKTRYKSLEKILRKAYEYCEDGVRGKLAAIDIAEKIVVLFENNSYFNAGKGSVYTCESTHELEASIMNGANLKCGSVALITNIKNPIRLATDVMACTAHNFLMGKGAQDFAKSENIGRKQVWVDNSYFDTKRRYEQLLTARQMSTSTANQPKTLRDHDLENKTLDDKLHGKKHSNDSDIEFEDSENEEKGFNTVGCVLMLNGNLVAATSTGGMTNKMAGRIGDTPIIGAGNYANNKTCAISGTGTGEEFQRHVTAYDIHARMLYKNLTIQQAIKEHVDELFKIGTGGCIGVDKAGNIGIYFNSAGMFRGWLDSNGHAKIGIWEEEIDVQL